jgi:hypothetical protein
MSEPRTIAVLKKNNIEELRVRLTKTGGCTLVDLRVFTPTTRSEGEPLPTRNGICLVRTKLPELIRALQAAERAGGL